MILNWHTTKKDALLIARIVKRAVKMFPQLSALDMGMDITAVHLHGCPLKLGELLKAPDFDFAHDLYGIRRHIDRKTGKFRVAFCPRYAKEQ